MRPCTRSLLRSQLPAALTPAGEINGKSCNLNHCLESAVYPHIRGTHGWQLIPKEDVVVVFDADMICARRAFAGMAARLPSPRSPGRAAVLQELLCCRSNACSREELQAR